MMCEGTSLLRMLLVQACYQALADDGIHRPMTLQEASMLEVVRLLQHHQVKHMHV